MNIFSTNQVTQVYVVNNVKNSTKETPKDAGDVIIKQTPDKDGFYFVHMGPEGITRSDIIYNDKILYRNVTTKDKICITPKIATFTLADNFIEKGLGSIIEDELMLRLTFDGYIGISPEDSTYWKYGVVNKYFVNSASDFYKAMALSLAKNMSREAVKMVSIYLKTSSNEVEVLSTTAESSLTGTYTGLVVKEVEQGWIKGLKQLKPLRFTLDIVPVTLKESVTTSITDWGTVAYTEGTPYGNGKIAADYEYFFHGERGDQYRYVGYPDYVPTEYLVDPSKEYDMYTLHYYYDGSNEGVQKSEKTITIICDNANGVATKVQNAVESIVTKGVSPDLQPG